jgi:uncharacterized repeat protein (TIGR01451 family)
MTKSIKSATVGLFASVAVLAFPAVALATNGQVEGGDIYRIKNVTKNVDFTDPASADKCDLLTYKVRVHNPGPSPLTNVKVKATLPGGAATTHTSTVTVSADNSSPASTSDNAVLKVSSSQSIAYQSGSTQLLDAHDGFLKTLPDGITSSGVTIGNVGVSIEEKRFVQFNVKVDCPVAPPQVSFACTALDVVKVSRTQFDFTAHATATNVAIAGFVFNAKDSTGKVVDTKMVATSANSAKYSFSNTTPGTYTISSAVETAKGGTSVDNCVKQVVVESVPPVTPPTPTPTPLPNTGPGDVFGLFAGASGLGAAGHFIARRRK